MSDAAVPPVPPAVPPAASPAGPDAARPRDPWAVPPLGAAAPPSPLAEALRAFWAEGAGRAPVRAVVTVGCVGLAATVLLVGHRPGLGAAVVGAAVWLPAVPALWRRRAVGGLLLVAAAVALVAMTAVRDAPWVVALCVLGSLGAGLVAVTDARSVPALLAVPLSGLAGFVRALPWVSRGVAGLGGRRRQMLAAARSVAVTAVLLGVFGALLASADGVFAAYLAGIDLDLLPARLAVGAMVAAVAAATLHLAAAPPAWGDLRPARPRPAGLGEWLLPVASLAALVLGFIGLQVSALLGGHEHVLRSAGLTYAEYARSGFGQLMAVTVLALLVVALAARRAPRATRTERVATAAALGAMCVGTLGVVVSALVRMNLYVEAYGLTRLRVFVLAVEAALGVVFLLVMVAGARWRGEWLPRAVVGVAAASMLALALVNPDALVLRHNAHADLAVQLDVGYLRGLSADAVPAAAALDEPLRSCLLDGRRVAAPVGPADWNLGRARAADVLADVDLAADGACAAVLRADR